MSAHNNALSAFIWGQFTLTVATLVLGVAGLVGGEDRPWIWIVGSGAFIVVHAAVNSVRSQSIVRRLGPSYDLLQRRMVRTIADLGELSGYDLWMTDLYLPRPRYTFRAAWPPVVRKLELSRQLSVSLTDARSLPPSLDPSTGPHGHCFSRAQPVLWFDESGGSISPDNSWSVFAPLNEELGKVYGVLKLEPVVDQLGGNCVGVLAVHVGPDAVKVVKALGTVREPTVLRRINDACVDLNRLLAR